LFDLQEYFRELSQHRATMGSGIKYFTISCYPATFQTNWLYRTVGNRLLDYRANNETSIRFRFGVWYSPL